MFEPRAQALKELLHSHDMGRKRVKVAPVNDQIYSSTTQGGKTEFAQIGQAPSSSQSVRSFECIPCATFN